MDEMLKKASERFYQEFNQMYSKAATEEKWTKECVENMKNLLKCIYYADVIVAMHGGEEDNYDQRNWSGARSRNAQGQFSRNGSYSYGGYPMSSGRRYSYDDERMNAIDRIRGMMDNESNGEVRMALERAMHELNMR